MLVSELLGLFVTGVVNACEIDPDFCPSDSHFVEARGYPGNWLVTSDDELGLSERVLWPRLRFSMLLWSGIVCANWLAIAVPARLADPTRRLHRVLRYAPPVAFLALQVGLVGIGGRLSEALVHVASFALVATLRQRADVPTV